MAPWTYFLFGFFAGLVFFVTVAGAYLRKWMISASRNNKMVEGLIGRLAKTDRKKKIYREELEKALIEVDQLRDEKLRNWDIPEEW